MLFIHPVYNSCLLYTSFHAYKRQLMNIMKVMDIYNRRIADPNFHVTPTTFIFSGKARCV